MPVRDEGFGLVLYLVCFYFNIDLLFHARLQVHYLKSITI
jgi:hypothetical protein